MASLLYGYVCVLLSASLAYAADELSISAGGSAVARELQAGPTPAATPSPAAFLACNNKQCGDPCRLPCSDGNGGEEKSCLVQITQCHANGYCTTAAPECAACVDEQVAADNDGDQCAGYYNEFPSDCGCCDDSDFTANEMCCGCAAEAVTTTILQVCQFEGDGECDVPQFCPTGTDIEDCTGPTTCPFELDGECDVETGVCPTGTDIEDCTAITTTEDITTTPDMGCPFEDDGVCDTPVYCPVGTDVNDCVTPPPTAAPTTTDVVSADSSSNWEALSIPDATTELPIVFGQTTIMDDQTTTELREAPMCSWLSNTDQNDQLECVDGTLCIGWTCCTSHGGRAKCPPNYPEMCNSQTCGGGDHCCSTNCDSSGGKRPCMAPTPAPCSSWCNSQTGSFWNTICLSSECSACSQCNQAPTPAPTPVPTPPPTPAPQVFCMPDDAARRRSGPISSICTSTYCSYATKSRRRSYGGQAYDTCQTTCATEIGECQVAPTPAPTTAAPTPAPDYALQTSGSCNYPITTIEGCSAAGVYLDLSDTTASDDNQNGVSYDPPYCYFEANSLKFNSDGDNSGSCSNSDQCVCSNDPYPTLTLTTATTSTATREYSLQLSGSCGFPIPDMESCSRAAAELGLGDTTVEDDRQSGVSFDPPYCYYEGGRLKFNVNGQNSGGCTSSDRCLCSNFFVAIPTQTTQTTTTITYAFSVQTTDSCQHAVSSIEECSEAAAQLGLSDTTASDDRQDGRSYDPPGCYFESSSLKYNQFHTNTGQCTNSDQCICRNWAGPTVTTTEGPYSLQTTGECAYPLTDEGECSRAAASLGLTDTTASNDNQNNGVSYDPPYCYFEANSLKFNPAGKNTGGCTSTDKCLCSNVEITSTSVTATSATTQTVTQQYSLQQTENCAHPIPDMESCSRAAAELGLLDTTASDDGQSGVSYDPPYCYFEGGALKFNVRGENEGSCSWWDKCLCSNFHVDLPTVTSTTRTSTTVSTATSAYEMRTSGNCEPGHTITDVDECAEAAASLGLGDTTAQDDGQTGVSYDPPYCYFESSSLKFNSGGNRGYCSDADKCICSRWGGPTVTTTRGLYYLETNGEECEYYISTEDECSAAASVLGLRDTASEDDRQNGVNYDPPGCYFEASRLKFNVAGTNTGSCSSSDQCVCTSVAPTSTTQTSLTTSTVTSPYKMQDEGSCAYPVPDLAHCSSAAAALGLGTTASDDDQQGVSYDPPYCYFEGGRVKFNSKGGNTGSCTSFDQCICSDWEITVITTTTLAPPYILTSEGECHFPITSIEDCSAAGSFLGLNSRRREGAQTDNQNGVSYDPPYCYFEGYRLKFNSGGSNTGGCTQSDQCLCAGEDADPPFACSDADSEETCLASNNCVWTAGTCQVEFVLQSSGSCPYEISDINGCAAAAAQLGLSDTTPTDDGQSGVSYDPPYCYFESNSLKFNSNGGNYGSCRSSDKCLCSNVAQNYPTSTATSMTTTTPLYLLVDSDQVPCHRIFDINACTSAGTALGLASGATPDGQNGVSYDPPWCYLENNVLKFNAGGSNTGKCTSADQCVCGVHAHLSTTVTTTLGAYSTRTSGHCAYPVTTLDECAAAASDLGLGDTTAADDGQNARSYDPPYCYFEGGLLKFNSAGDNVGYCSSSDMCVCSNIPVTTTPHEYVLRTDGFCLWPITDINICSAAAGSLGLQDTTASGDGQRGVSYDPPGCYFEGSSLKFNPVDADANKGACSSSDKCVCQNDASPSTTAGYFTAADGTCDNPVTTADECSAAAAALGLMQTQAEPDEHAAVSYDPPYCYWEAGLKFNAGGNTGPCSSRDICICASTTNGDRQEATVAPAVAIAQPVTAGTMNRVPILVTNGNCMYPITDMAECASAAFSLGVWNNIMPAEDDNQHAAGNDPPWCYHESFKLKFNSGGTNTGKCTPGDRCICWDGLRRLTDTLHI